MTSNERNKYVSFLQALRVKKGLPIEVVSNATDIPLKLLESLENERYTKLPEKVYIIGFLKKLAIYYQVDQKLLIDQFKLQDDLPKPKDNRLKYNKLSWNFVFTPKVLVGFISICLVVLILGWLSWQLFGINSSPRLTIREPVAGQVIKQSFIKVDGFTDAGAQVLINNEKIQAASDGNFSAVLSINTGTKQLSIQAISKFGKITTQTIPLVIDLSKAGVDTTTVIEPSKVYNVIVRVTKSLPISLTVDGQIRPTQQILPDSPFELNVKSKLEILTPDAGSTLVTVNGQNLGTLGREGQVLSVPINLEESVSIPK